MKASLVAVVSMLVFACREPSSRPETELAMPDPIGPAEPVVVAPVEAEPTPAGPMVEVPAGEFTRGSDPAEVTKLLATCPSGDDRCNEPSLLSETPATRMQLPSFWIDRREVTNAEYEQCIAAGFCAVRRLWQCMRHEAGAWHPVDDPSPYLGPDQPAVCISHGEAAGYCFGRGARLPSRSEWEKAARGSDGRRYPWGDDPPTCEHGNVLECGRNVSEDVGSHPEHPSPCGALDMAGNVAEWVMPDVDPNGMYEQGSEAEIRGGHFGSAPVHLRAAARMFMSSTEDRTVDVGFRCVADQPR